MARPQQWYGVKTLYRSTREGRPKGRDSAYAKGLTSVEERVVLVRARTFKEAIRKAEREAEKYAKDGIRNRYGQPVVTRYLGYCEAYDMSPDDPDDAVEVFSVMELVPSRVSDKKLLDRSIGHRPFDRDVMCANFGNVVFQAPAKGVELTSDEKAFVLRGLESLAQDEQDV